MKPWLIALCFVLCGAASVPVVLALDLSLESALVLAPVLVLGFAALAGLVVLWTRVAWQELRGLRRRATGP